MMLSGEKQHGNYRIQQKNKGDEPATQFKARTLLDGPLLMADHSENASLWFWIYESEEAVKLCPFGNNHKLWCCRSSYHCLWQSFYCVVCTEGYCNHRWWTRKSYWHERQMDRLRVQELVMRQVWHKGKSHTILGIGPVWLAFCMAVGKSIQSTTKTICSMRPCSLTSILNTITRFHPSWPHQDHLHTRSYKVGCQWPKVNL